MLKSKPLVINHFDGIGLRVAGYHRILLVQAFRENVNVISFSAHLNTNEVSKQNTTDEIVCVWHVAVRK